MKRFRYWFVAVAILSVAPFAVGAWENSPWDTVVWKRFVNAVTGKTEIKADIDGDGTAEATVNEDGDTTVTGSLSASTMYQTVTAHGSVATGTVTFTPGVHTLTVAGVKIKDYTEPLSKFEAHIHPRVRHLTQRQRQHVGTIISASKGL